MNTPDFVKQLEEEMQRMLREKEEAARLLAAAHETFAPVPSPALRDAGGQGKESRLRAALRTRPDLFITYPAWVSLVGTFHLIVAPFLLGAVGCAVAIISWMASPVDAELGVPVARLFAFSAGVIAGSGLLYCIWKSFLNQLEKFPW